ncbi:MAG: hypothetical protein OHM77_05000 [Candidatus Nitricoxidivorans perseverans]|uniref:Uncharacterized protein n=1 Tax=Candidatus Nitricoxidivorans perseverans TaxID=2975601 RepID=A0AA49IXH4_9PROT|nr:MAG: hypothetical protein OHM77_05000 [Candidatus Nitricoxidivorans perseverans]
MIRKWVLSVRPPILTKYAFRIRTRVGSIVNNLLIHGRDEMEAQFKLRQMYRDCEIMECVCHSGGVRTLLSKSGKANAPSAMGQGVTLRL